MFWIPFQHLPVSNSSVQFRSKYIQKVYHRKFKGEPVLFLLSYNVLSLECTHFYCPLFYFLAWIGFGFKVGGTEDSPEWQRSFTASSMLTSPLSSPPCSTSSSCLESSIRQMASPPTAHISLTAATHVVLLRSHMLLSYALYVTRLNQFGTFYTWSTTENKTWYYILRLLST